MNEWIIEWTNESPMMNECMTERKIEWVNGWMKKMLMWFYYCYHCYLIHEHAIKFCPSDISVLVASIGYGLSCFSGGGNK